MTEEDHDRWYQRQIADFPPLLAGTVEEAWSRCLPIWRERGRIEDYPRGVFMTKYSPWKGKFLAYEFVKKFRDDYSFLLPFLCSENDFLRVSAVELLDYLCCNFEEVPDELLVLQHPLPDLIKSEIDAYWAMRDEGIETVGDLLRSEHMPDGE